MSTHSQIPNLLENRYETNEKLKTGMATPIPKTYEQRCLVAWGMDQICALMDQKISHS
jgi:hypothetical protein